MTTKTENLIPEQLSQVTEFEANETVVKATAKKAFVEPEVSFPIDVLEATTFFQVTDSGVTNP
ncbi:MAG TPA: hypothetical protein VEX60_02820 [Pyrinomonadaceae bacterium]|nr:hypothetical protein [Pyrinomonadaceae bacterium]